MAKYLLSPQAQTSLKNIQAYSLEHFGKKQTTAYLKNLRDCLRDLAATPSKGTARDDIKKGYHSYFVGSHTIYYRISNGYIGIIDVLHQRMEPTRHLLT
jgi:toxin ParE1/3/4